jgi:type IV pilus assembly protein PilM
MAFFSSGPHALIGLDVSFQTLRVVQLRKIKAIWKVYEMAFKRFTEDIFSDCKITNWQVLGAILNEFVQELNLKGQKVAVHIPAHLVRMQRIKLPKEMRGADIEAEIYAQVQRDLPGRQETLSIDYKVMKTEETESEIFFVAARQGYLSEFIMCVNGAGLQTKIVDVDIFALRRAIFFSLAEENYHREHIVLYVVDDAATLVAFSDETITFLKHWEIYSSPEFLQEFNNHLQICLSTIGPINRLIICAEKHLSSLVEAYLDNRFIIDYPMPFYHGKLLLADAIDESFAIEHSQAFLVALGLSMRECPKW